MQASSPDEIARETLRAELEALAGVRRAVIDGPPWKVFLICDPSATNAAEVEIAGRALLSRTVAHDIELQLCFIASVPKRHRVRFLGAAYRELSPTRAVATVRLEWNEAEFAEEVEGDSAAMAALRLPATATVRALERVVAGALHFQLVGIKVVRVFDGDLAVAVLHSEQVPRRQMIGATLVSAGQLPRSAALAVLNATNRAMGNFLEIGESES